MFDREARCHRYVLAFVLITPCWRLVELWGITMGVLLPSRLGGGVSNSVYDAQVYILHFPEGREAYGHSCRGAHTRSKLKGKKCLDNIAKTRQVLEGYNCIAKYIHAGVVTRCMTASTRMSTW